MPLHNLPPEILYDILGEVVASYVERAVTSSPIDGWETLDSELHSEWFTDEEDSSDDDVDFASDVYESEEEPRTSSGDSDNPASDANASSSIMSTSSDAPEPNSASNQQIVSVALSEEESNAMEIWASEQERTLDPENMLEFKLYLWNVLELREGLPRNDIAPLLSVCRYVRETTIKVLEDSIGVKRTADGRCVFVFFLQFVHCPTALTALYPALIVIPGISFVSCVNTTALHTRNLLIFLPPNIRRG